LTQNSLGKIFTVTVYGESHGKCIGAVVDGCPAGLALTENDIQIELDRRRPVESIASTARVEKDRIEIFSGTMDGFTTGAPVCMMTRNEDVDDAEYERTRYLLRPGHADYTAHIKYGGYSDWRGGGRFSGRITAAFVMAGAVARKLLSSIGIEVVAHTVEIGGIKAQPVELSEIAEKTAKDPLRCADAQASGEMKELIAKAKEEGDSLGGIIECVILNVPAGLGEPAFDNLDSDLAKAIFAIPAVKGVEFGAGFAAARMKGSENNDSFAVRNGKIVNVTNNAGGILGGISSGMPIVVRAAVKPTPSIAREQATVDVKAMENTSIRVGGRHDTCIVPRAVAAIEAVVTITLCDFARRAGLIPGVLK
jgi:chorismate synthase